MVEVGRAAVAELGLRAEVKVFAIVKATAVRILG
jgi:molybdopterin-binding protein